MKHFLNSDMLAPNVSTFTVDHELVASFGDPSEFRGRLSTIRPRKWRSDIEWISAADEAAFDVFQSAFDALGIAAHAEAHLDLEQGVRLYAGFLVIRSTCAEADFHVDWAQTNNEAFTCMTPVSVNSSGFGLLYKQWTGAIAEYDYAPGEAISFGDFFEHSTKPGHSDEPVTLLCFEYGTDKMDYWPKIYRTIGEQVTHLRRPDGQFVPAHGKAG